jgi:hypothetical protein
MFNSYSLIITVAAVVVTISLIILASANHLKTSDNYECLKHAAVQLHAIYDYKVHGKYNTMKAGAVLNSSATIYFKV